MTTRKIGHDYEISDELWKKIEPLLPLPKPKKKSGRPRKDDKKILTAIFYILRTGCQWKALPRSLGAPALCMIDFRSGGRLDYSRQCGKQV